MQDNPGELLRAARAVAAEAFDRDTLMKASALVCLSYHAVAIFSGLQKAVPRMAEGCAPAVMYHDLRWTCRVWALAHGLHAFV